MSSKKYRGKVCAYCGAVDQPTTAEHVLARSLFLPEDRSNLPKIPACSRCNSAKSKLETYAAAALLAGSQHFEAVRVRREFVSRSLAKNQAVARELGIYRTATWMSVNGVFQKMHPLTIDAAKIKSLMDFIVRGLYYFHNKSRIPDSHTVKVSLQHPGREQELIELLRDGFGGNVTLHSNNFGRNSFAYEMLQSNEIPGLAAFRMMWHGGITLYGSNSPPQGIDKWWAMIWPDQDTLDQLAA